MLSKPVHVNVSINTTVIDSFSKIRASVFILPLLFLIAIALFLYQKDAIQVNNYIQIQKNCFFFINSKLSLFPHTIYNLAQLGDALICLSFLTIFMVHAPKIWDSLLSASLVSAIFSFLLKKAFAIPRPAAMFDNQSFAIIGKTLNGHNSLPSGHSITVFTTLTVLLFAFMPKKLNHKMIWCFFMVLIGLLLVFTRVGVGAHYPFDVITGSIVGYICGLIGIFIHQKYKIWAWIGRKKYYPILILLLLICCFSLIIKISNENLIIFYFSLTSLVVSLYKLISVYVQK